MHLFWLGRINWMVKLGPVFHRIKARSFEFVHEQLCSVGQIR